MNSQQYLSLFTLLFQTFLIIPMGKTVTFADDVVFLKKRKEYTCILDRRIPMPDNTCVITPSLQEKQPGVWKHNPQDQGDLYEAIHKGDVSGFNHCLQAGDNYLAKNTQRICPYSYLRRLCWKSTLRYPYIKQHKAMLAIAKEYKNRTFTNLAECNLYGDE